MPDRKARDQRDQVHEADSDADPRDHDERTSLAPLSFEEAMKGLLAVKPDADQAEDSDTEDH
jgi:hypothetical protein